MKVLIVDDNASHLQADESLKELKSNSNMNQFFIPKGNEELGINLIVHYLHKSSVRTSSGCGYKMRICPICEAYSTIRPSTSTRWRLIQKSQRRNNQHVYAMGRKTYNRGQSKA